VLAYSLCVIHSIREFGVHDYSLSRASGLTLSVCLSVWLTYGRQVDERAKLERHEGKEMRRSLGEERFDGWW